MTQPAEPIPTPRLSFSQNSQLHHAHHPEHVGCGLFTMFALTGNHTFLAPELRGVQDMNELVKVGLRYGCHLTPLLYLNDLILPFEYVKGFMNDLQLRAETPLGGFLDIHNPEVARVHRVAFSVHQPDLISVSDNLQPGVVTFEHDEFLKLYGHRLLLIGSRVP